MGLGLALKECAESDSNFPASKKDEVKSLMKRFDKIIGKMMSPAAMPEYEISIDDTVEVE